MINKSINIPDFYYTRFSSLKVNHGKKKKEGKKIQLWFKDPAELSGKVKGMQIDIRPKIVIIKGQRQRGFSG